MPAVELLEDRLAPATFGVPWADPSHLTLSFAPDGTQVADQSSALFQTLGVQNSAAWKTEILRAFQTWAVQANINIGLVADSGLPLGTPGLPQGDPRFGDIRIATYPLAPDVVAVSLPFAFEAGTWSGDVKLNPAYFQPGSSYDLYTVLLHEAGHVFGFPDSTDPTSVMYETFIGPRAGLSAGDIAGLQSLYGPRQPDAFDAAKPNDTMAQASMLTGANQGATKGSVLAAGDITTASDVDWYTYHVPSGSSGLTVTLHTQGLSLLVGRLSVYDAAGNELGCLQSTGPLGDDDLTLHIDAAAAGKQIFVKVEGATGDVFGIGGYELAITPDGSTPLHTPKPPSDNHTNDTPESAVSLQPQKFRSDARFAFAYTAAIDSVGDVDFYRFNTPKGAGNVMTVSAWGNDAAALHPELQLYTADGIPIAAQVLVNEDGTYTIQLPNVLPNTTYLVAVRGQHGAGHDTGGYFLDVNFDSKPVVLDTLVAGQALTAAQPTASGTLHVLQSQLMHFVLSATGSGCAVDMTVVDGHGNTLLNLRADAGSVQTTNLELKPGDYTIEFAGIGLHKHGPLAFTFQAIGLTDPVGPHPVDATLLPSTPSGTRYWWEAGFGGFLNSPPPPGPSTLPSTVPALVGTSGDGSTAPTGSAGVPGTTTTTGVRPGTGVLFFLPTLPGAVLGEALMAPGQGMIGDPVRDGPTATLATAARGPTGTEVSAAPPATAGSGEIRWLDFPPVASGQVNVPGATLGPEFLADLPDPGAPPDTPVTAGGPLPVALAQDDVWSYLSGVSLVTVIVALALYPILRGGETLVRPGRAPDDLGD
jgi:hypothetical protein